MSSSNPNNAQPTGRIIRSHHDGPLANGQTIALSDTATRHLIKVLRLSQGDALVVFNGHGGEYPATLVEAARGRPAVVTLGEHQTGCPPSPLQLELLQGLARGERMDYAVQKATELGMARFWPIAARYSELRLSGERAQRRQQHWQQIAISACEQNRRCDVPTIELPQRMAELPERDWGAGIVLDPEAELGWAAWASQFTTPPTHVSLAIGPVGGWHADEVAQWVELGFQRVRVGPRVLRTETAGPAVMAALQAQFGDWR
jgi:16S rRNA (uracil1498-N3)-methyltransferase